MEFKFVIKEHESSHVPEGISAKKHIFIKHFCYLCTDIDKNSAIVSMSELDRFSERGDGSPHTPVPQSVKTQSSFSFQ